MKIGMLDIFRGFARNYNALKLEWAGGDYSDTKYTNLILNYFLRIGEFLGFQSSLEGDRKDLVWTRNSSELPILHLEHENSTDLGKVKAEELDQLAISDAECLIGIFYPSSIEAVNEWVSAINEKLAANKDILIILNPVVYEVKGTMVLHGFTHDKGETTGIKHYTAEVSYPKDPAFTIKILE